MEKYYIECAECSAVMEKKVCIDEPNIVEGESGTIECAVAICPKCGSTKWLE